MIYKYLSRQIEKDISERLNIDVTSFLTFNNGCLVFKAQSTISEGCIKFKHKPHLPIRLS